MMERIKKDIGELIPDSELKAMIARGIEKALFEERPKSNWDGYGRPPTDHSIVDSCVISFIDSRARQMVNAWLDANPEKIKLALNNAIQAGISRCVLNTMSS